MCIICLYNEFRHQFEKVSFGQRALESDGLDASRSLSRFRAIIYKFVYAQALFALRPKSLWGFPETATLKMQIQIHIIYWWYFIWVYKPFELVVFCFWFGPNGIIVCVWKRISSRCTRDLRGPRAISVIREKNGNSVGITLCLVCLMNLFIYNYFLQKNH